MKILPILLELLKDDNADVKLKVVEGLKKVADVIGPEVLQQALLVQLSGMTKDGQWRVRMAVFELIAFLGNKFEKDVFVG